MSAYHHHPIGSCAGRRVGSRAKRACATPAAWVVASASRSLRVCDAMRGTTPAQRRDTKWEVDSKAEVDGS